jgi:hypothetical protein
MGAESLLPGWWLPHILIGSAILIAVVVVTILLVRLKNRTPSANLAKQREAARLEALTALNATTKSTTRDAAIRTSLILRRYLASAADDPALFETHEEFITRRDSLAALSQQARDAASAGFARLAKLKYSAAIESDDDPSHVINDARTLLDQLHNGFTTSTAPAAPAAAANPQSTAS